MNIEIHFEAQAEVDEAHEYWSARSATLGDDLLAELQDVSDRIADDPTANPILETLPGRHPFRRVRLKVLSYIVVYAVQADLITIVAVSHASRRPNYWLKRRHDL